MRVGLVCPYDLGHPGGVQGQVLGLAGHLAERGHTVSVMAPGRPATGTLPGAAVRSAGRGHPVPANGSVARLALGPAVTARVAAWLELLSPDVLHVHEPGTPGLGTSAVRRARQAGVPTVTTFHAARPGCGADRVLGPVLRRRLGPLPVTTAVSESAAQLARSLYGVDPEVLPNAIDVAAHARADALLPRPPGMVAGAPTVLFLGRRDEPRKGLDVLAAALPLLRQLVPGVQVVLAGPGRTRVDGTVDLGEVDGPTRLALLHTCEVLVAPHTGRESFGIVLAEAMAAGTPVVASSLPAFAEVVGDAGLLVPVGDPDVLARAVATVLTDRRLALELGERGAARARRWDWAEVVERWEQVYDRACGAGGPAS
ncbi:glycosyltransferase family 4 protein [Ornithinimicrobium avium]|uniref:D-inositol 3-phosphate glycosyltransferase n=1 Tax=Ornithinimicrobium avium TaxID=2283195 RepID=A0A345NJU6_9MICO|nr:glycosyltransferase family 4 protein [Ornithinimicrobium avium]AXH95304.1 glycosyltransferase family 1 protein [Ornithinimicrobium avium]